MMKKILRFQLRELLYSYLIYALVMLLLTGIPTFISYINDDVSINIGGSGFSSAVFCLVLGIALYKEHLQMAVQNSITRKCFFKSTLCVMAVSSLICSLVDMLAMFILVLGGTLGEWNNFNFISMWQLVYTGFFEKAGSIAGLTVVFLLMILIDMLFFVVGVLIAGGYCRLTKRYRTVYCVALPVFICGVFPVAGTYFHKAIYRFMCFLADIMGVLDNNPFMGMLVMAVTCLVIAGICYRLLRRTEIA